jgi:septal ring factor EnvC (AmiA/AmiB activator)
MQPDLLSTQLEEHQPEPLSSQERLPSEPLSTPETPQFDPTPTVEAIPAVQVAKKRSGWKIAVTVLAVLATVAFLLTFAWVGYWAYTLNNQLQTTQQELAALQTEHAQLESDYAALTSESEKLTDELAQSKADLEQSNTDLTSTQSDLSKSKQNEEKLQNRIDAAGQLLEILYVMTTSDHESDILKVDRLVYESKDQELIKQWDTLTESPSEDAMTEFLDYLVSAMRDHLK